MRNIRFAWRSLVKSPVVSVVAVLSLALGIGANTAIFSIFEQVLLRKLPVPTPGELVNITSNGPKSGSNSTNDAGGMESIFSYAMFRDLEAKQSTLTGLAAHRSFGANVAYQGQASVEGASFVSGSYFPVLGLQPAAGRLFTVEDDRVPGAHQLVVLSHRYWRKRFNESPEVIGKTMVVNGRAMTILGVGPEGFNGTSVGTPVSVFVPISMREALSTGWRGFAERRSYWVYLFGRLKPGVSLEAAEAQLHSTYINMIRNVELPLQKEMSERTRKEFVEQQMALLEGSRGQSQLYKEVETPMLLLFAITGFVLLIACANIANLLLARSANRAKEFSIRMSLGAGSRHVMAQVLAESMLLALLAGATSMFVAYGTVRLMQSFLPGEAQDILNAGIRLPVVVFAFGVAVVAGLLFGLFPAYHATRSNLAGAMKAQAGRFRSALVVGQIALCLTLLVAAGLLIQSLTKVLSVDVGMRTHNVLGFRISPESNQYSKERTRALFEQIEQKAAAIAGVEAASTSMVPLISGNNWGSNVSVDGFEAGPDTDTHSMFNAVGAGYFRMMQVPLIKGREFGDADGPNAPKVAVVNEAFERKFGNGGSLVGKRMQQGAGGKNEIEIVGVVKNTKYSEIKRPVPPLFFLPYRQAENFGEGNVYLTTAVPVETIVPAVRRLMQELDPNLPLEDMRTMEVQIQENIGLDRMISTLAGSFAGLATLLAIVGLYGVVAFNVARRTREIGIRMALGADRERIRGLVMGQVGWLAGIGVLLGLPAAVALARFSESLLFEIQSGDPLIFVVASVALVLAALLAGYLPARKAMKVEPLEALRYE